MLPMPGNIPELSRVKGGVNSLEASLAELGMVLEAQASAVFGVRRLTRYNFGRQDRTLAGSRRPTRDQVDALFQLCLSLFLRVGMHMNQVIVDKNGAADAVPGLSV